MNLRLVLDENCRVVMEARASIRKPQKSGGHWSPNMSMQWIPDQGFHSIQTHIIEVPAEQMRRIQYGIAADGVVYFVLADAGVQKK